MKPTLSEVRGHTIDALYAYLHEDNPQDAQDGYLQPHQIAPLLDVTVSKHFFGHVIQAMRDDGTIEPMSNFWMFRLSPAGVVEAESRVVADETKTPASDRFVSRTDNTDLFELEAEIGSLAGALQTSNEAGAILGSDREALIGELEAASLIASKTRVRLKALWSLLMPTLRFLSEKFASGAIGDAAKRLIELLLKII
jgi:hypothetical protein